MGSSYKQYEPDVLKHLQEVELMILRDVINILDKHNLKYYVYGGTALGSVRHGGFIPWDDDIDIILFRKDYLAALNILSKNLDDKFEIFELNTETTYPYPFIKVYLKDTYFKDYFSDCMLINTGIYIDIMVLDNVPNLNFFGKINYKLIAVLSHIITNKLKIIRTSSFIKNSIHLFLYSFLNLIPISLKTWKKLYFKLSVLFNKNETNNVIHWFQLKYVTYNKEDFEPAVIGKFEDLEVRLPKEYDKFLTKLYGNYMKLPPEDERYNHAPEIIDFGKY